MKYLFLVLISLIFIQNTFTQTLTSSNLPIFLLQTNRQVINDEPKITVNFEGQIQMGKLTTSQTHRPPIMEKLALKSVGHLRKVIHNDHMLLKRKMILA
jgi:hypothetical protein